MSGNYSKLFFRAASARVDKTRLEGFNKLQLDAGIKVLHGVSASLPPPKIACFFAFDVHHRVSRKIEMKHALSIPATK